MTKRRITQQQIDEVLSLGGKLPHRQIAERVHISSCSVSRILSGKITKEAPLCRSSRLKPVIIQNYPDMLPHELEEKFGVPQSTIRQWAIDLNLKHTPETIARRRSVYKNLKTDHLHTPEVISRRSAKRRKTVLMEKFRIMSGMRQQTKLVISMLPRKTSSSIRHLVSRYSYFRSETDSLALHYDEQTRRTSREEYFSRRYGIKFISAI